MKLTTAILISFISASTFAAADNQQPKAMKGVIDLSGLSDSDQFTVRLNGEWEFYWMKMLRPHDFAKGVSRPDMYGKVPAYWTDYPGEIVGDGKTGYATYRLRVILPEGFRKPLACDMPVFDSSYDLYINGRYLGYNGIPGTSSEDTKPEYRRVFFRYEPVSDTLDIIINVSNFDHRRGGFWLPVQIGTFSKVQKKLANNWAMNWSSVSLLIGFSLFFFFFYLINPREKLMLYFSVATTGLALRPFFTSHYLIYNFLDVSWIWTVRFEYIGLYMIVIGWLWFIHELYPHRIFRRFIVYTSVILATCAVLTNFLPVRIFGYATQVIYPVMVVLMLYAIIQSFRRFIRGSRIDLVYFSAIVFLAFAGVHDIRLSLGKAAGTSEYYLTYAVIVFIFIQAALLLYSWIKSYQEKERLQNDLEYMNRNLELMVNERTQELKSRNDEIEQQNQRIASQNVQLSETIQMKNKIFSVIAHDLRSPVVNILYMLNLLKEKEYKEKYDTFANASIEYAQLVISLLENMLVWGRGQQDKINYSPESRNLADIVLTNMSILKESADKKEISVNFTQAGNSYAFFDKDLLDIIIRNLLSNAVKFTPRGGRISILLKERKDLGGILLKICDNGIGISPQKQEKLFSPEDMSSTPGTENEKGTGIGLKLCHELVLINKGTLTVESREGEGSCFSVVLPDGPASG